MMTGETHRFTVGKFLCVVICDADQTRDGVSLFASTPAETVNSGMQRLGYQPEILKFSINILYIRTPERSILVDSGLGVGKSQLTESLLLSGIELNRIDDVILTHGHGDHIGGLTGADGQLIFPRARYHMWKAEWDYWMEQANQISDPEHPVRKNLPAIKDRVQLIETEGEFLPGIHAIHAPGHTAGHMVIRIESGGEQFVHLVDAIHHPSQITYPEWSPQFDQQPVLSAETRKRLIEMAEREQIAVMAYHFPFPGMGHVIRDGDELKWHPI